MDQTIEKTQKSYSVAELARQLGVSPYVVRSWVESGELPAINFGTGTKLKKWRILESDILDFLERRSNRAMNQTRACPSR